MNENVLETLTAKACASIRYRTRKEILEENPDINDYIEEILDDKRVKYVFTWQKADGYLGHSFHGGWIPDAKLKYYNTGAEGALRFLSEVGIPKTHPVVEKGLKALLKDNWLPDPWKWWKYQPEIGLFGADNIRAVVFAYFGIEEHDFNKTEIKRVLDLFNRVTDISSIESITGTYQKKLYFNSGIALPDIYYVRLLAFTRGWRSQRNTDIVAKALRHLVELSPIPHIYIKCQNQLVAPAQSTPLDLKKNLNDFQPIEWFTWMRTMEYFARMGVVKEVPAFLSQANELKALLHEGGGFFPFRPSTSTFEKWNVYAGLALEDSWKNDRWKYDLTFRALLILKYSGLT
jgi:hypothetical protein